MLFICSATSASAVEGRDPTRPGWSPPSSDTSNISRPAPSLLTAIMIGEYKRLAVFGDRHVGIGDTVAGAKLIRIAFDHIVLRDSAGERILRLTPLLDSRSAAKVNGP